MSIPESAVITKSNVFTQVFANIYNLINDRTNIPNPNDSTGNTKFVYSHREPNYMSTNFSGYPFIIVESTNLNIPKKTASTTKGFTSYEINIIIMSQDKVSDGSGNPSGADTLNSISNDVLEILNANHISLRNNGLRNMIISGTDFDWGEVDGQQTFRREITLLFDQVQVIA